jgi:N-acetylneuraminic acid mutarotase
MPGARLSLISTAMIAALGVGACGTDSSPTGPVAEPVAPAVPALDVSSPAANTWLTRPQMPTARAGLVAATVNGNIYAIGGQPTNGAPIAKVEKYDPDGSLFVWSDRASLPSPRSFASGAAVINGKIYVTGGFGPGGKSRSLYVYNAATNSWSAKTQIPVATAHGASVVIDGKLYVLTPPNPGDPQRTKLHRYTPGTDAWAGRASAPVNLEGAVVGAIDGKLYAAGGMGENGALGTLYVYNPATDGWTKKADMPMARTAAAGQALGGKLYVVGGNWGPGPNGTTQVYTPGNNSWTTKAWMPTPRYVGAAATAGGWLYVLGGVPNAGGGPVKANEAFVP